MKIFYNTKDIQTYLAIQKSQSIGFVPTMGALHEGHISLIATARQKCHIVVVSIFVNPTQFLASEDIDKYPSKLLADENICRLAKVDVLFVPTVSQIYHKPETKLLAPSSKAYILEGIDRPGHFDGVLQVVLKLFHIVRPDFAFFGKKDAQQLYLVQNMVETYFLDISIVPCETVRETTGLAKSSRNSYLSSDDRIEADQISKSLKTAVKQVQAGEHSTELLKSTIKEKLANLSICYVEIVDRQFDSIDTIKPNDTIILVAVSIGKTRLIDNIWL